MLVSAERMRKGEFAQRMGVSAARVSQWVGAGMPVEPDGTVDVQRASAWVSEHVDRTGGGWPARKVRRAMAPAAAAANPVPQSLPNVDPQRVLILAKAKREAALARRAEREERRHAGELVEASRVGEYVTFLSQVVRDAILSQPDRLASKLAGANGDATLIHRIVREDGHNILNNLSKAIAASGF